MTNTLKLKSLLVANGFTQQDIADYLCLSNQSVSMKLNNKREFKASEIDKLCKLLKLEDMQEINLTFFCQCCREKPYINHVVIHTCDKCK